MEFTINEIIDLAIMAGISVDRKDFDENDLETELTVEEHENKKYAYYSEYPEEGHMDLG